MGVPPLTEDQRNEVLDAFEKSGGNQAEAARILGIPVRTFGYRLQKARMADGQKLNGISTLYDKDGNERLTWVKTTADLDRQLEITKEAAEAFMRVGALDNLSPPSIILPVYAVVFVTDRCQLFLETFSLLLPHNGEPNQQYD